MNNIFSKNSDTGSCSLHFLESGNPEGKTVVLLHGMKYQATTWQELGTLDKIVIKIKLRP